MNEPIDVIRIVEQLLIEFRKGSHLDNTKEKNILEQNLSGFYKKWEDSFNTFPKRKMKSGSLLWKFEKAKRSKHLIDILSKNLNGNCSTIINHACYDGKRARQVAIRNPHLKVIGCDIDPHWNNRRSFIEKCLCKKEPSNYSFVQDNVFDSKTKTKPDATVFFGACGSVSDAIMDFAIEKESPYLLCRICCHENIGGNTSVIKRNSLLNFYFRLKNKYFQKKKETSPGCYFSNKYSANEYPRSKAVRNISDSKEYMQIAQTSVDSQLCATLIDLDRYCYLVEKGYEVLYRDELFIAWRK